MGQKAYWRILMIELYIVLYFNYFYFLSYKFVHLLNLTFKLFRKMILDYFYLIIKKILMLIDFILIAKILNIWQYWKTKCALLNQLVSMKTINCILKTLNKHHMLAIKNYHQQSHGALLVTSLLWLKLLWKSGHLI